MRMTTNKPLAFSFSRIELFDSCPWAFKKVHIDKIPRGTSEPLITGQLSHQVVADYLKRLINLNLQTDWEWAEKQDFVDAPDDVPEIWERFYQNFILPPMVAPAVEEQIAFNRQWQPTKFFADDAFFRMVVDWTFLQDNLAVVQDWKTNRKVQEINPEKIPLQLRIYGWGVRRAFYPDMQEVLLRLHYLRYGVEKEILLTPQNLDTVPKELEQKIAVIQNEKHFDPTPGSFCSWCGLTAHCPVMANALLPVNVVYPATRTDAEKAAEILLTLQTVSNEIRAHLKAYVQQNGPVPVGDMVYGPSPTETWELNPQTVTDQLLEMGVDRDTVWSLLRVTKTDLEKLARKILPRKKQEQRQLLEQVKAGATLKTGESIGFIKAA